MAHPGTCFCVSPNPTSQFPTGLAFLAVKCKTANIFISPFALLGTTHLSPTVMPGDNVEAFVGQVLPRSWPPAVPALSTPVIHLTPCCPQFPHLLNGATLPAWSPCYEEVRRSRRQSPGTETATEHAVWRPFLPLHCASKSHLPHQVLRCSK